jgi:hypothetical protein
MAQVIQVEIRTGTTHTLTWLDAALKLKPDMALVCNGDPRPWIVVHAYNNTPREMIGIHSCWHVGGLRSPSTAVGRNKGPKVNGDSVNDSCRVRTQPVGLATSQCLSA